MGREEYRKVAHRRIGRVIGALSVIAFAALGSPGGTGLVAFDQAEASGTVIGGTPGPVVRGGDGGSVVAPEPPVAVGLGGLALPSVPSDDGMATVTAPDTPPVLPPVLGTATAAPVVVVPPSAPNGVGIPGVVLAAYKDAANDLATSAPGCHVPWSLIAGIGRVESGHASGGRVDASGNTRGRILGPRLDGSMLGTGVVRDTDGGALDGDSVFDRAVGPMQFLPGTWKTYARDGNHDGVASPHNVFDAALAAGSYLCAGGSDLSQPIPEQAALLRYNHSVAYGNLVMRWSTAYAAGVAVLPGLPGDVPSAAPTPPEQVPAPAAGSNPLALAGRSDDADDDSDSSTSSTTTTTTTTTKSSASTTPTTTTPPPSSSSPVTTTPEPSSSVTTTPPPSSSSPVTTTPEPSSSVTTTPEPSSSSEATSTSSTSSSSTASSSTKTSATRTSTTKTTSESDGSTSDAAAAKVAQSSVSTTPATPTGTSTPATTRTRAKRSTSTKTTSTKTTSTKAPTSTTKETSDGGSDGDG